ncbi:MAG: hypothetical protein AAF903_04750 [Pseudomonadota bacterium]
MKSFIAPFCCLSLLAAAVFYNSATVNKLKVETLALQEKEANKPPPLHTKSDVWIISSPNEGLSCLVYHGRTMENDRRQVNVDSACDAMVDRLSFATVWRDLAGDTVRFIGSGNETLAEFGPTDGTAYVSRGLRDPIYLIPSL